MQQIVPLQNLVRGPFRGGIDLELPVIPREQGIQIHCRPGGFSMRKRRATKHTAWELSVCGWLKDKYGVNWQVTPAEMEKLMESPGAYKILMRQKKIIIAEF